MSLNGKITVDSSSLVPDELVALLAAAQTVLQFGQQSNQPTAQVGVPQYDNLVSAIDKLRTILATATAYAISAANDGENVF